MARPRPSSLPAEERHLRSQLHQLLSRAEGMLHGSLIEMARRCGKPTCRCATDDDAKHRSLYLGRTKGGKTSMDYIPKDLEATARAWAADYKLASELLDRICLQGRDRLKERKRQARSPSRSKARSKTAKKKTPARAKRGQQPKPPPS
jgi:hypothetical protein